MTRTITRFGIIATLLCLQLACKKNASELSKSASAAHNVEECDNLVRPMINSMGTYAEVAVWNDADNLYIKITALNGAYIARTSGVLGSYAHLQAVLGDDNNETTGPMPPDFSAVFMPEVQTHTFTLPLAPYFTASNCIWMNVHAKLVVKDAGGNIVNTRYVWAAGPEYITSYQHSQAFQYCRMTCTPPPPPPPPGCDTLRTNTPGGWGAPPNGNNTGAYLHANFNTVFGGMLTVGCFPGNYYVQLTSAQAITNLLPTGGQAGVLTSNAVNPPAMKNVLVGHLVALKLSTGFDAADPDFGEGGTTLGNMEIGSGLFEGWTVSEFITEADKVLGGCSTAYTVNQILQTATAINENYVDGLVDKGFLVCPGGSED